MKFTGLSSKKAEENLKKFGYNEFKDDSKFIYLKILFRQIKGNLIFYLLLLSSFLSFVVDQMTTGYVILFVIIIVVSSGFFQEYKAERSIRALKDMVIQNSVVIRDGKEISIPSRELVKGDIILLSRGDKVPADCLILKETGLILNEASLTGESKEVEKSAIATELDKNKIFMGTFILNGKCVARVLETGERARLGKISKMISSTEKELLLQKKINNITKYMAIVAISFSILIGILSFFLSSDTLNVVDVIILMIALSVSAFPEGLPVVLTTCLSSGAYRMAKKNVIVNRLSAIETLGETTVICSDKTGTITRGEMFAKEVFAGGNIFTVSDGKNHIDGDIEFNSKKISLSKYPTMHQLLKSSVLCNDAILQFTSDKGEVKLIGSPTESALLMLSATAGIYKDSINFNRVKEIEFDSSKKLMVVSGEIGKEKLSFAKGALEQLLPKCKYVQKDNGIFRLTNKERELILDVGKNMSLSALRTISLAYKKLNSSKEKIDDDLIFLGIVGMQDPPKQGVKEAIEKCFSAGIKVKMITGDSIETATAIAKQIGLTGESILGCDLDNLSDKKLRDLVKTTVIFARVRPEHKLRIVKALKENGEIVTMTGDGVNDAPALKESHIGVAMGKNGTDVSRSVADLTLKDDNFSTIVTAIREGRGIFGNIKKFTNFMLSCNYAELSILLFGVVLSPLLGWKIPLLLSIQILFMNLVTDDSSSVMLSMTPYPDDIMNKKPRKGEQIVSKKDVFHSLSRALVISLVVLVAFFVEFNIFNSGIDKARTSALLVLIMAEIASAFSALSSEKLLTLKDIFTNKHLAISAIVSMLATTIIIYSPLNSAFGTAPLLLRDWVVGILLFIFVVLSSNLSKYIKLKKQKTIKQND